MEKGFAIALTNLGQYNEGILNYVWLTMPATEFEIEDAKKKIGIGMPDEFGNKYEELFISDYDDYTGIGLAQYFGEYASINSLNKLARKLDSLTDFEFKKLQAICETECYSSPDDVLEFIDSLNNYSLTEGVKNEFDYGYYLTHKSGLIEVPAHLKDYIDYERLGSDYSQDGDFTSFGYLERI